MHLVYNERLLRLGDTHEHAAAVVDAVCAVAGNAVAWTNVDAVTAGVAIALSDAVAAAHLCSNGVPTPTGWRAALPSRRGHAGLRVLFKMGPEHSDDNVRKHLSVGHHPADTIKVVRILANGRPTSQFAAWIIPEAGRGDIRPVFGRDPTGRPLPPTIFAPDYACPPNLRGQALRGADIIPQLLQTRLGPTGVAAEPTLKTPKGNPKPAKTRAAPKQRATPPSATTAEASDPTAEARPLPTPATPNTAPAITPNVAAEPSPVTPDNNNNNNEGPTHGTGNRKNNGKKAKPTARVQPTPAPDAAMADAAPERETLGATPPTASQSTANTTDPTPAATTTPTADTATTRNAEEATDPTTTVDAPEDNVVEAPTPQPTAEAPPTTGSTPEATPPLPDPSPAAAQRALRSGSLRTNTGAETPPPKPSPSARTSTMTATDKENRQALPSAVPPPAVAAGGQRH